MSETALSKSIRQALEAYGCPVERIQSGQWRVGKHWIHGANAGTPDLWTPWGWFEVKREGESLRPEQELWRARMSAHGVRVATVSSVAEALEIVREWRRYSAA